MYTNEEKLKIYTMSLFQSFENISGYTREQAKA